MDTLALKLVLTPALVGTASLAGRWWGPAVSGWFVGFPLTSGPVAFFLAIGQGHAFAAAAAAGTLAGTASQAVFCLTYAWLAFRVAWALALVGGLLAFGGATVLFQARELALAPTTIGVMAVIALAARLMPRTAQIAAAPGGAPRWDIPARMVVATVFVLLLTSLAPILGPRLTGLLSPFPLFGAVLTIFAHHLQGPAAAAGVLRGLVLGLFAFAAFFVVLAARLESWGLGPAFAAASVVVLLVQIGALRVLRSQRRPEPGPAPEAPV
jgi:hypothetical protein